MVTRGHKHKVKLSSAVSTMERMMTIEFSDFINVEERAKSLGCNIPTGIALLPSNFEDAESKDELFYESNASTVRALFRGSNISETPLEHQGERFPEALTKGFEEWIGPIIFVGFALYSQNPLVVSVALGVVSNYLTDYFKGIVGQKNAKLDIVIETRKKAYKKIHYEGNISGLEKLADAIYEVCSDD